MSLSINALPAARSDRPAASESRAKTPNGLPFKAILDQTDATDRDGGSVEDADEPIDAPSPAVDRSSGTAHATGSRGVHPAESGVGTRRLPDGSGESDDDAAIPKTIREDQRANEAAAWLLLAADDALQRLESQARVSADHPESASANAETDPPDAQLLQRLLAETFETEAALPNPSHTLTDSLNAPAGSNAASDDARLPELPFSRATAAPPAVALIDAIRLATSRERFADQDDQQSMSMGFDRRSTKSAAPILHLAEGVGSFESALRSAGPSPVAATPSLPDEAGVVSSIVQTMRLQMRDGVGTAVVHLEPDYLGAVSIALRVENGAVTATLHAENPQVRAWMEANEPLLRESLAGQGLSLDRLLITDERIADERSSSRRQQREQEQHARQRPRRDDATTFEVVV